VNATLSEHPPTAHHGLTIDRLLVLILFLGIAAMALRPPLDTDSWWHLRSGQFIVETRGIPFADPFTHTVQGQPWIDHGWLAQVGLYLLYRAAGVGGLSLGLAVTVTLALWFVYRASDGNSYVRAFALALAALTSAVIWIARPQIVSFLLSSVVLYVLYLYKHRAVNRLVLLPVLMAVWVNVHGGYIVGFILMGGYLIGEALNNLLGVGEVPIVTWRRVAALGATMLISVPAVLLNPNTSKMLSYPFFTVGMSALQQYIEEWASPNFHHLYLQPFLWLLLITLAAIALSRARMDFTDLVLVGAFAYLGLTTARNVALFALVATPIVTRYGTSALDNLLDAWRRRTPWGPWLDRLLAQQFPPGPLLTTANWTLVAVLVLAVAARAYLMTATPAAAKVAELGLPVKAAAYIESNQLPGPLFNSYNWGGYLIWRLHPSYPVFIDGRTDLFDGAFMRRYVNVTALQGDWQDTLDHYRINTILTERDSPLARFLPKLSSWTLVYVDDVASVLVKDTPENGKWTASRVAGP
jgi:hypothetical protein